MIDGMLSPKERMEIDIYYFKKGLRIHHFEQLGVLELRDLLKANGCIMTYTNIWAKSKRHIKLKLNREYRKKHRELINSRSRGRYYAEYEKSRARATLNSRNYMSNPVNKAKANERRKQMHRKLCEVAPYHMAMYGRLKNYPSSRDRGRLYYKSASDTLRLKRMGFTIYFM